MWVSGKESTCQCRKCRWRMFDPWVGMIPWRRKWPPTLVFLPAKSHRQRSLVSCPVHGVCRVRHDWAHTQLCFRCVVNLGSHHFNLPSDPHEVARCPRLELVITDRIAPGWRWPLPLSAFSPQGVWLPCPLYRRLQHEPLGEAETAGPVVERAGHPPPLRSAEGIFCLCVRDVRANQVSDTRF